MILGILLCVGGIIFLEPLMRAFGASDASLAQAKDYAFWMFVAALANLPAQSMNCAARAESSVKITSIAVVTGAALMTPAVFSARPMPARRRARCAMCNRFYQ